jgi:hypothetical protein
MDSNQGAAKESKRYALRVANRNPRPAYRLPGAPRGLAARGRIWWLQLLLISNDIL